MCLIKITKVYKYLKWPFHLHNFVCLWQRQNVFWGWPGFVTSSSDAKVSVFSPMIKLGGRRGSYRDDRGRIVANFGRYISPPQPSLHITFTAPAFHQHLVKIARGRDRERRDRRKHKLADLKEFRNLVKCGDGAKIGVELWSWKDTELS